MVTRSVLPQNYEKIPMTLFQDFEDLVSWNIVNVTGTGTTEDDTTHVRTGSKSIKFNITSGGDSYIWKQFTVAQRIHRVALWLYCYDEIPADNISEIMLRVSSTASQSNPFGVTSAVLSLNADRLRQGWNYIAIPTYGWGWTGSDSAAGRLKGIPMYRIGLRITNAANKTSAVSFDSMYVDGTGLPRCIPTFDDTHESIYSEIFDYMYGEHGMRGTIFINPGILNGVDQLTEAQLAEMSAAGWTIANHGMEHISLDDYEKAVQRTEILDAVNWLLSNGCARGAYHYAYAGGAYNNDTLDLMSELGMLSARTIEAGLLYHDVDPYRSPAGFNTSWNSTVTYDNMKATIDSAIAYEAQLFMWGHRVYDGTPRVTYECSRSLFRQTIDYLSQKDPIFPIITIDEWYEGLTNPRYRSLPVGRT